MTLPWLPHPSGLARIEAHLGGADAAHLDGLLGGRLWEESVAADVALTPADRARSAAWGRALPPGSAARILASTPHHDADSSTRVRGDGVVCLRSAAWIHMGGAPPQLLEIALPRALRARFGPVSYRWSHIAPRDVEVLGGVRVTSALATACDLALALGKHHDRTRSSPGRTLETSHLGHEVSSLRRWLDALLQGPLVDPADLHTRLLATRRPHTRSARAVVAAGS